MKSRLGGCLAISAFLLSVGCTTTVLVKPVNRSENNITLVCIKQNPKVIVPDFIEILQEGFARHGIKTQLYSDIPESCEYSLTYTATQKWDFKLFMSDAHLALYKGPRLIASADRDAPSGVFGGGGINPSKWDSTRSKLDPMIDEILKEF